MSDISSSSERNMRTCKKKHKTHVERRRRERINKSLLQIKELLVGAMNKNPSEVSKLEKADILEMAVGYLKMPKAPVQAVSDSDTYRFKTGYSECATEVLRYLSSCQGVTPDMHMRISLYLQNRMKCSNTDSSVIGRAFLPSTKPAFSYPTSESNTFVPPFKNSYSNITQVQRHLGSALMSSLPANEEYRISQTNHSNPIYQGHVPFYLQNQSHTSSATVGPPEPTDQTRISDLGLYDPHRVCSTWETCGSTTSQTRNFYPVSTVC